MKLILCFLEFIAGGNRILSLNPIADEFCRVPAPHESYSGPALGNVPTPYLYRANLPFGLRAVIILYFSF